MDTLYLDPSAKFLDITLQEIDSLGDIGPYDDDGDARPYRTSVQEINSLLNIYTSSQAQYSSSPI
jgi:hypothetical protein